MRGCGFDQRHVADAGAARHAAFQQVVAQYLLGRQAAGQHALQRGHMQQALAGEAALAKEILVDLGRHRVVGIAATGAGKEAVKDAGLVAALCIHVGPGRHEVRLQDAVAGDDAPPRRVNARPVQRMRGDAHQLTQRAWRQHRVAVERDDVGRAWRRACVRAQVHERALGGARQQRHQLLQLAALALPADPALFAHRPLALPVQQQEARHRARVACGQRHDGGVGLRQQRCVGVRALAVGVGKVGEQGKLRMGFAIGQVMAFQALHQGLHGVAVTQHRRQHDQHAVFDRDAVGQCQAWQPARWHRFADQAVQRGEHGLAGRPQRQRRAQRPRQRRQVGRGDGHETPGQADRARHQGRQPEGQCDARPGGRCEPRPETERAAQRLQARPLQPVAQAALRRQQPAAVGQQRFGRQRQQDLGHGLLAAAAAPRQSFDGVQRLVLRVVAFGSKGWPVEQAAHQRAGLRDQAAPIGAAQQLQRADGVADAEVVCCLLGLLLGLRGSGLGQGLGQCLADGLAAAHALF